MADSGFSEVSEALKQRFGRQTTEAEAVLQERSLKIEMQNLFQKHLTRPGDQLIFEISNERRLLLIPDVISDPEISNSYVVNQLSPTTFSVETRTLQL